MKHTKRLLALLLSLLLAFGISVPAMANVPGTPGIAQQPQSVELDPTYVRHVTMSARGLRSDGTVIVGVQWQRMNGNTPVNFGTMTRIYYADVANGPLHFRAVVYNAEDSHLPLMERRHVISDTITVSRFVPPNNPSALIVTLILVAIVVPLVVALVLLPIRRFLPSW